MNLLQNTIQHIIPSDKIIYDKTQNALDNLTKPQGSLGELENIAKKFVSITKTQKPKIRHKVVFVFAGDHGVAEENVSAFPQEVTLKMIYNLLHGGAAVNVLARNAGAQVIVADLGSKTKPEGIKNNNNFRDKSIAPGTKNFAKEPAMTKEEAVRAIEAGIEVFEEKFKNGIDLAAIGEMGIANTTSASAIVSCITETPVAEVTGRGTGIDDESLKHKIEVIEKALELHKPDITDGIDILSKVGGFEIGGLAGVILAAARHHVPLVIDGFIATSAALIAALIEPKIKDYIFASHASVEIGHKKSLEFLELKPLFDFGMRLGEGSGAVLAMTIIESSAKILSEMSTFADLENM